MAKNPLHRQRKRLALKHLQAAIKVSQLDLSTMDKDALQIVEQLVLRLMQRDDPAPDLQPGQLSREVLEAIRQRLFNVLKPMAEHSRPARATVAGDLSLSFWAVHRKNGPVVIRVFGTPIDRCQYHLVQLLQEVGVERLMVCPAHKARPETGTCGRIFLKLTRKDYCSTTCQSRAYMRAMREEEKRDEQKARTRRR